MNFRLLGRAVLWVLCATSVYGQQTATITFDSNGLAVIHNNSDVSMTSFIVTTLFAQTAPSPDNPLPIHLSTHLVDSLTDTWRRVKAIPPGGTKNIGASYGVNGEKGKVQLQAALFADGTTFGDPQWVDYLIRHRRTELRVLNAAMDDLQKNADLPLPSLIEALTAARSREDSAAKSAYAADADAAHRTSSDGRYDLLRETSAAQKKANIMFQSDADWSDEVVSCYRYLVSMLQKVNGSSSMPTQSGVIAELTQALIAGRLALTESKPTLIGENR